MKFSRGFSSCIPIICPYDMSNMGTLKGEILKKHLTIFITFFAILSSISAFAGVRGAGIPATMITRNFATTTLGTAFTDASSAVNSTVYKGVNNFLIYTTSASDLVASVKNNSSCGSSSRDEFVVPATNGIIIENVAVGQYICLRTTAASSATTGKAYISAW